MPSFLGQGPSFAIASGQTVSDAQQIDSSMVLVGLFMPAAFTGATVTYQASIDGVTFQQVIKDSDGLAYTSTVSAAKAVQIPPTALCAWNWLKVVSASAEGADRSIKTMVRSTT